MTIEAVRELVSFEEWCSLLLEFVEKWDKDMVDFGADYIEEVEEFGIDAGNIWLDEWFSVLNDRDKYEILDEFNNRYLN